jgi:hypothetical protein
VTDAAAHAPRQPRRRAPVAVRVPPSDQGPGTPDDGGPLTPATLLALQRKVGNQATTALVVKRRRPRRPPDDEATDQEVPALQTKADDSGATQVADTPALGMGPRLGMSFAFFFVPESDDYGKAAHLYVAAYYPDHKRFDASSFEDLFAILGRETQKEQAAAGSTPVHVDEVILVSHANAGGAMKVALTNDTAGRPLQERDFTPEHVSVLQDEARAGLHRTFLEKRAKALGAIDQQTRIVVRGCELGKESVKPLDALAVLFGGQPDVMAPTAFQGFQIEGYGPGQRLKSAEEAYDWLVTSGYLSASVADVPRAEKEAYIRKAFPRGIPSDFYLTSKEAHDKLAELKQQHKALSPEAEDIKYREKEDPTNIYEGRAEEQDSVWAREARPMAHDKDLALPRDEVVARAEALMTDYKPTDAGMFLRLWRAWQGPERPDETIRREELHPEQPLERVPAVFNDENLWRAQRDLVLHPDASQDALLNEPVAYAPDTAEAQDFSLSTRVGLVDPNISPAAAVPTPKPLTRDAALVFLMGFGDLTSQDAVFGQPELPETRTSDDTLDAAAADVRYVVLMLRAGLTLDEVNATRTRWEQVRPVVTRVATWAGANGYETAPFTEGSERVERRLNAQEATIRSRTSEEQIHLPDPAAGIHVKDMQELEEKANAHQRLLDSIKLWDFRHPVRVTQGALSAASLDQQIRQADVVRLAIGWAAVFQEASTFDERMAAAARKGLLPTTATAAKMVSHATSVLSDSVKFILKSMETRAGSIAASALPYMTDAEKAAAELFKTEAEGLKMLGRGLSAGAGVVAIVSGTLDLVKAVQDNDNRAARAAVHSIAQGAVSLGAAITGASAGATALVSGSLVVVWGVLEAIAMAAEAVRNFERQRRLDAIRAFLDRAESLLPWGKRMAGVSDAWEQLETEDPRKADALTASFLQRAGEPYRIVVSNMLEVGAALRSAEFDEEVGVPEKQALDELDMYQYRELAEFGPGDMREITKICVVLFTAMQRIGADAVKRYGD